MKQLELNGLLQDEADERKKLRKPNQPGSQTDSWRPDWKRSDQYPFGDSSLKQWAWEFLRRSEKYKKDYVWATQNMSEEAESGDSQTIWFHSVSADARDEFCRRFSGYGLKTNVVFAPGHEFTDQMARIFRGDTFPKTKKYDSKSCSEALVKDNLLLGWTTQEVPMVPENEYEIVIKFDVRPGLSIPKQIDKAKKFLKGEQNILAKNNKRAYPLQEGDLYKRYLRVLDARHQNVAFPEILKHLVNSGDLSDEADESTLNRNHSKAMEMCAGGYRELLIDADI